MKLTVAPIPFRDVIERWQVKPMVILSVSTVTLITWKCFGSPQFYMEELAGRLGWFADPQANAATYSFFTAFLLMGVLPALIVKFVFRESLADYGVCFGNAKRTIRSIVVYSPGIALIAYLSAGNPTFCKEYPINHNAGASPEAFLCHALAYFLFYVGWEFQFRGFMQRGLQTSMGDANALLIQVMVSTIVHIGKPVGEIYGAILGGIIWGILVYRTRSLLSGLMQHAMLGILLDWFICHRN